MHILFFFSAVLPAALFGNLPIFAAASISSLERRDFTNAFHQLFDSSAEETVHLRRIVNQISRLT
jgi:hypothetical protein